MTISGKLEPNARSSVRVHEKDLFPLAPCVHVQPVPETLPVIVNQFGSVSSTIVVPVAVTGHSLRTMSL